MSRFNALLTAIDKNNKEKVRKIVTSKPSLLKMRDPSYGRAPIHRAVGLYDSQGFEMIQCLLELGDDLNRGDYDGKSPLYYAVGLNNIELINLLLLGGAKVDQANNSGETPLSLARFLGNKEIIERLEKEKSKISVSSSSMVLAVDNTEVQESFENKAGRDIIKAFEAMEKGSKTYRKEDHNVSSVSFFSCKTFPKIPSAMIHMYQIYTDMKRFLEEKNVLSAEDEIKIITIRLKQVKRDYPEKENFELKSYYQKWDRRVEKAKALCEELNKINSLSQQSSQPQYSSSSEKDTQSSVRLKPGYTTHSARMFVTNSGHRVYEERHDMVCNVIDISLPRIDLDSKEATDRAVEEFGAALDEAFSKAFNFK